MDATSSPALTCNKPPMMMMPEMALVTLIKGVCSDAETDQTTCQPTKHASTNTVECCRNSEGAKRLKVNSTPIMMRPATVLPQARRVGD